MGLITFTQDDYPFELALQTSPTAVVEGEIVVVTLPVYVPGLPQQTARVRMPLSIQQGEQLHAQLEASLTQARRNGRIQS